MVGHVGQAEPAVPGSPWTITPGTVLKCSNSERQSPWNGEDSMTSAIRTERSALIVRGGWDGHQPVETTNSMIPFLEKNGFTVRIEESPAVYTDADYLATVDLILQINTMASITTDEFAGLQTAVLNGTGMGGWQIGRAHV